MKNDIHALKNELAAISQQQQQNATKQTEKDQQREIKETVATRCRLFIVDAIRTGETLASIYNDRETIIEVIAKDIADTVCYVDTLDDFKDSKKAIKKYKIDGFVLESLVSSAFYSEFIKLERDQNKAKSITKKQLEQDLRALILQIIGERPEDIEPHAVIAALEQDDNRCDLIERVADTDTEREILSEIYQPTLAKIKREYPKTNNASDGHLLPLPWRIIAGYKAIGKIWKL